MPRFRGAPHASISVGSQAPFFADRRPYAGDQCCKRCKRYLWNSEKRTVCDRNALFWLQLILFYGIFLGALLGIMFLAIILYSNSLRGKATPVLDKKTLLSGNYPGLGFVPSVADLTCPLITYMFSGSGNNRKPAQYVERINQFLQSYAEAEASERYVNCTEGKQDGKLCYIKKSELGPCGESDYGYTEKKPCIYLKLNKLKGWIPKYYDNTDSLPYGLQAAISQAPSKDYIWVNCFGSTPYDAEHLGNVTYYPIQGFSGNFFPYQGERDFLSPIVAIQFSNARDGVFINVRCNLYAKNIVLIKTEAHNGEINLYLPLGKAE